ITLGSLWGCAHTKPKGEPEAARKPEIPMHVLTRETAVLRSKHLTGLSYQLWLKFSGEADAFQGRVTIQFDTKKPAKVKAHPMHRLPIDFSGGEIQALKINDTVAQPPFTRYDGQHLFVEASEFRDG